MYFLPGMCFGALTRDDSVMTSLKIHPDGTMPATAMKRVMRCFTNSTTPSSILRKFRSRNGKFSTPLKQN